VTLTIKPTTGLLSGRFIHPVTRRKVQFQGAVLPDENRAAGFFVGKTTAGALELTAKEVSD